ncbi:MAG: AAA family ATPase [Candidatus Roizmanbacteria bacterium]
MILTSISLSQFRNFSKQSFSFDSKLTFIIGPNSIGKTNLLEAIYFLLSGVGVKEERQEELLKFGESSSTIGGTISENGDDIKLDVFLEKKENIEKKFFVNKLNKTYVSYLKETIPAVFFAPQRIEILTRSPSSRRSSRVRAR